MDNEEIKEFIEKLKKLDEELKDENEDSVFEDEINSILEQLNDFNDTSSSDMKIKVKKINQNAVLPKYAKTGDAGLDLTAIEIVSETEKQITYGIGIALEIPDGFVGLLFPRSSIRKYDLILSNCVGVIDSGYRGEIQVTFNKSSKKEENIIYSIGDKVAQLIILPHPKISLIETSELNNTERGDGGFGSTGN